MARRIDTAGTYSTVAFTFEDLPPESLVRAFGVDYCHLTPPDGGDLYVTRFGWPLIAQLMPGNWFTDDWYAHHGERLPGSTGAVYHVLSRPVAGRRADLLVKFSRMAQEVPLVVQTTFPDNVPPETIAAARFNSPMEEFGLLMELRQSHVGHARERIRTQRPLAIYAPPDEFQLWQLGRDETKFTRHRVLLAKDQEDEIKAIELDIRRIYVLLYQWVDGDDAAQVCLDGQIDEAELSSLTRRVISELSDVGFRVLDNKPQHFILRRHRRTDRLLRREDGLLTYALVDYELLQRTSEHQKAYKVRQRERYAQLLRKSRAAVTSPGKISSNAVKILGIDYVYGSVPDRGCLWVAGHAPELFEYYVPDRWRRTPRVRLSRFNEVYRTHTRDNIYIVYRRSRVGTRPRVDPLSESERRIRDHGYNSPFEEVAIAEQLRMLGISTTMPLAIYRTGHHSNVTPYLKDNRRFDDGGHPLSQSSAAEPFLIPNHDYYTIWELFRGLSSSGRREMGPGIDLDQACELSMITVEERDGTLAHAHEVLAAHGILDAQFEGFEIGVHLDDQGRILRNEFGEVDATVGFEALIAVEIGLLDEPMYQHIIRHLEARLHAADCEKLDLKGSHILLSMDARGRFKLDKDGDPIATLCNFEFIRGLYRPLS